MRKVTLVVCLLGVMLATALGYNGVPDLHANIPFQFLAGGKSFSAGNYTFTLSSHNVQITNQDTNEAVILPLMTRIATDKTAEGTAKVSFDVQDGKHFIEAVWPQGEDGYLLHTVKGEHTHKMVKGM